MDKAAIIKCRKCGMPLKKGTRICSYCGRRAALFSMPAKKEKKQARTKRFRDGCLVIRLPWVSLILILLNAAAGVYKLAAGEAGVLARYGMVAGALQRGEFF